MFGFGTITNTTINADGCSVTFHSNSLSPWGSCNSFGSFSPGCFGYGFPSCGNPMMFGAGAGLGFAAGMALAPALPKVFKGIGSACSWVWNNAITPAFNFIGKGCSFMWNKAIVPAAKGVWSGIKWVGNGIASAAKWVGNGVKNLWNSIFHKGSKA